jgi:hypothetical protein
MARKFESKLNVQLYKIEKKRFIINTPLGNVMYIGYMYKGVVVTIGGQDMKIDLIPLELHDFDVILGMDW